MLSAGARTRHGPYPRARVRHCRLPLRGSGQRREAHGALLRHLFEGKTYEEIAREQPEAYSEYRDTGECGCAEVERSEIVGERFRDAVLEAAAACRSDQSLIIVSHGSAIARGIVSLLGLDPADFNGLRGVDNCHWSELVPVGVSTAKSAARTGWRLASHNIGAREDILGA